MDIHIRVNDTEGNNYMGEIFHSYEDLIAWAETQIGDKEDKINEGV